MIAAADYGRISEDKTGEAAGVERQVEDNQGLIRAHPDWQHVGSFVDNDISALTGLHRPRYEALLDHVRRGEVQVIVIWQLSRLWRNRRERAEAFELFQKQRIRVVCVKGSDLDFSTASGRMVAGIVGEVDTAESEVKAERVERAAQQRAEKGRPNGGVRSFGFTAKGMKVIPKEAKIIREVAGVFLAGEKNLSQIARDLDARGVKPPRAASWNRQSVRCFLRSHKTGGRRYYRGQDIGPASWKAILDEATWLAVRERLAHGETHQPAGWSNRTKYLLAGLAVCGLCESRLWSHSTRNKKGSSKIFRSYSCTPKVKGGCRGVSRSIPLLDAFVEGAIVARMSDPAVLAGLVSQDAPNSGEVIRLAKEIKAVRARLIEIAEEFADTEGQDEIGRAQFRAANRRLRAKLEGLVRDQEQLARRSSFGDLIGVEDFASWWWGPGGPDGDRSGAAPLIRRRAVVRRLADVVVYPSGRNPRFDPDKVKIAWRELGGSGRGGA